MIEKTQEIQKNNSEINPADHIGLIGKVAKRLISNKRCRRAFGNRVEDYLGQGWIGLQRAAEKYKGEIGKFSTYAYYYIYWYITRELDKEDTIRVPNSMRSDVAKKRRSKNKPGSFDRAEKIINGRKRRLGKREILYQDQNNDIDQEKLCMILDRLGEEDPIGYEIVIKFYGIGQEKVKTKEIAKFLKCSSGYVGVLKKKALNRLYEYLNSGGYCYSN